mmetsp:Transcript_28156/g.95920  ORF Transcript_28156/g.95920 Transcript_28156/m.95920 type:complete len:200 (+) Transcript_28156:32-631(+)
MRAVLCALGAGWAWRLEERRAAHGLGHEQRCDANHGRAAVELLHVRVEPLQALRHALGVRRLQQVLERGAGHHRRRDGGAREEPHVEEDGEGVRRELLQRGGAGGELGAGSGGEAQHGHAAVHHLRQRAGEGHELAEGLDARRGRGGGGHRRLRGRRRRLLGLGAHSHLRGAGGAAGAGGAGAGHGGAAGADGGRHCAG